MASRAALLRRGQREAPEIETVEQTHRRLGHETPEETKLRLGLTARKERRRKLAFKTVAAAAGVGLLAVVHGFGAWHFSRAPWYHRALIAVVGILVLGNVIQAYRRRRAGS